MTPPLVAVVAHRRETDTPLGELRASLVYDAYLRRLTDAGADTVLISPAAPIPESLMGRVDGLLLIGGGDVAPERFGRANEPARDIDAPRDHLEITLVERAREKGTPVFGMCRGAQLLNVALGGSLKTVDGHVQSQPLIQPHHEIRIAPNSRTERIAGSQSLEVNSFHRWAVDVPAPGMAAVATAPDDVIEAIESEDDWFALGIQWHAELLDAPHVPALFKEFVQATGGDHR